MSRRKIPKWVVLDGSTGDAVCVRCKERERMPLPMPVAAMADWCAYFGTKHRFCKTTELGEDSSSVS